MEHVLFAILDITSAMKVNVLSAVMAIVVLARKERLILSTVTFVTVIRPAVPVVKVYTAFLLKVLVSIALSQTVMIVNQMEHVLLVGLGITSILKAHALNVVTTPAVLE